MEFDIFFSISQTPEGGKLPKEKRVLQNFIDQVQAADELGFGTAWIAESHLSSEVQKQNPRPVIPHWEGEVGLNTDIFQMAHQIFSRTQKIHVGSAVMNLICNGGPIAAAERIAAFSSLHGLDKNENRRLNIGFSAGRFDFMNRAYGVLPEDELEQVSWPIIKGKIFSEACDIFLRLLGGETISSEDIPVQKMTRKDFRTEEHWNQARALMNGEDYLVPKRWKFEKIKIVPQEWRRDLVNLVLGSHDPKLQERVNQIYPVQVFNLSITNPKIIEETHYRMQKSYHPDGGPWKRTYMPRTVFVFINEEPGLTIAQKKKRAREEAKQALNSYWKAIEGTLDPKKVEGAADNALVGTAEEIAEQIRERFHPEDRLMLWFDFFNHDGNRVISNMKAFMEKVKPILEAQ